MNIDKKLVAMYVISMVAGSALAFIPSILGIESKILSFSCVFGGLGIFTLSLVLLERHISERKRSDLLRRQQIEAKDERNTIIRDKAGAKTLAYILWVMLVSNMVVLWFNVEFDFGQWIIWTIWIGAVVYFSHIYYYNKRI